MVEFLRHDLVWLDEDSSPAESPVYVVTHQNSSIQSGLLSIACCLSSDKSALSRKCFVVAQNKISQHDRPVLLKQVIADGKLLVLPLPLLGKLEQLGVCVRVYGSFSWEYLTGQKFTTPDSDLDLLFYLPEISLAKSHLFFSQLHELILLLEYVSPHKIDGELAFPNGSFAAWREWFSTETKVLVKTTYAVNLLDKAEVLGWNTY